MSAPDPHFTEFVRNGSDILTVISGIKSILIGTALGLVGGGLGATRTAPASSVFDTAPGKQRLGIYRCFGFFRLTGSLPVNPAPPSSTAGNLPGSGILSSPPSISLPPDGAFQTMEPGES